MDRDTNISECFVLAPSQINGSRQKLRKFYNDGSQFVTNVKVAANAREIPRRQLVLAHKAECNLQLEKQANTAQKKFDEVASEWIKAKNIKSTQKLYQMILGQKAACDEVLTEKDAMILYLKEELRNKEEEYVQDLKKEEEDISLISQRIDTLIHHFFEASSSELNSIEMVIQKEYKGFLKENDSEWRETLKGTEEMEMEYERWREEQVLNNQATLHKMNKEKIEEYKILKEKLENDLHALQMELRRMKAVHLLNEEKLEYNYQVLKKQEEEDMELKMDQKRSISRLRDTLATLQKQWDSVEISGKEEYNSLLHERTRYSKQTEELKKKVRALSRIHTSKFHSVWMAKEEEAKALLHQFLDNDSEITKDVLKLKWKPPNIDFIQHCGPYYLKDEKVTYPDGENRKLSLSMDSCEDYSDVAVSQESQNEVSYELPFPVDDVLQMILEEMGFLLEDKVQQVLHHLQLDEKVLPTLDSIFRALKIVTNEDLKGFVQEFVKYMKKNGKEQKVVDEIDITPVLKEYLHKKTKLNEAAGSCENEVSFHSRNELENEKYWERYSEVLPRSRIPLWNSIYLALQKYYEALKERHSLEEQINTLKMQNAELSSIFTPLNK